MNDDLDPYIVLGMMPAATSAEITRAFRAKLRALHPDIRHGGAATAAVGDTQLRQVLAAYHLLRDPDRRADYDSSANPAAASPLSASSGPVAPRRTLSNLEGPVQIPVNHYEERSQRPHADYLYWAGPVRRHH